MARRFHVELTCDENEEHITDTIIITDDNGYSIEYDEDGNYWFVYRVPGHTERGINNGVAQRDNYNECNGCGFGKIEEWTY